MAALITNLLTSYYGDATLYFHCPCIDCHNLRTNISVGTFVQILFDNIQCDGLIVMSTNRLGNVPSEEIDEVTQETDNKYCEGLKLPFCNTLVIQQSKVKRSSYLSRCQK
jgi:hypothetical protein